MRNLSLAALAVLTLPFSASAAIFDDFNDGNDTGWTRFNPFQPLGAAYSFPGGGYRMMGPASPSPATVGPSRMGSFRLQETYTDFSVSVDIANWDAGLTNLVMGVLGRTSDIGAGTTDGYVAALESDGNFFLVRTLNEAPTTLISDETTLANLDITKDYRVTLSGVGSLLTASVFNITDNVQVMSISANDSTYASGVSGILAFDSTSTGNQAIDATFDNYSSVPEPASMGMLLVGAVGLFGRRLRQAKA